MLEALFAWNRNEEAPLFYNAVQTLRSVNKLAYFSYKDYYIKFEELPLSGALKDYGGELLLVGINYDKATKKHTCVIQRQE